ncbi:MAG: protein jag [Chloroflexi bacterium]|nr:protein jag [Chloroflexota bacterium]
MTTDNLTPDQPGQMEVSGANAEEAIQRGLAESGLSRSEVDIEILDEGSRGILGFNVRPARVRLTPLEPPALVPEPEEDRPEAEPTVEDHVLQVARETLSELLEKMHIQARVAAEWGQPDTPGERTPILLDVHGDDLGSLIGHKGETLNALQYITRLIVSREINGAAHIQIDVEGYKARRAQQLARLARRTAEQVKKHGRALPLEPMPANERRIIHITLRDEDSVYTESQGAGNQRKVTVYPR